MDEGDSSLTEEKISADLDKKVEILEASEENGGANESAKEKSESNLVCVQFSTGLPLSTKQKIFRVYLKWHLKLKHC